MSQPKCQSKPNVAQRTSHSSNRVRQVQKWKSRTSYPFINSFLLEQFLIRVQNELVSENLGSLHARAVQYYYRENFTSHPKKSKSKSDEKTKTILCWFVLTALYWIVQSLRLIDEWSWYYKQREKFSKIRVGWKEMNMEVRCGFTLITRRSISWEISFSFFMCMYQCPFIANCYFIIFIKKNIVNKFTGCKNSTQ